jgi:hypothetical protein
MDASWQSLLNWVSTLLANATGGTLVLIVLALLLVAFVLPAYLFAKALTPRYPASGSRVAAQDALVQSLLKGGDASVTLDSPDDSRENLLRALGDSPADLPRRLFGLLPANVKILETFTVGEPTVVKMGNDDLRKAADLLRAGADLDTICRQLNPEYAQWGALQQRLFRMTMEKVLKS